MKILVTDGDNRATLAIVRSLGRNHDVTVAAKERRSLAAVSRWCKDAFAYPDPFRDTPGFVSTLRSEIEQRQIDVLLPVADVTSLLIARHRSEFNQHCRIPIPDIEILERAANKVEVMELARRLGVPTPAGLTIHSAAEASARIPELAFPVVVKPARSRVPVDGRWVSTSVRYANDPRELTTLLDELHPAVFPVLLQERIRGPGVGLFLCYAHGRPIAAFSHRRLREKPPSGGVSVLRESIPANVTALDHARHLLEALKWQGVAMVEFKQDERDGSLRLMEINGRFWGSLQLAIDAGVDFPDLLIRTLEGDGIPAQTPSYRSGVRSRWLWGDVDALLMLLFKESERRELPEARRGRWRALRNFFRPQGPDCHWEVLRASDIKPWLLESWRWLTRLLTGGRPGS